MTKPDPIVNLLQRQYTATKPLPEVVDMVEETMASAGLSDHSPPIQLHKVAHVNPNALLHGVILVVAQDQIAIIAHGRLSAEWVTTRATFAVVNDAIKQVWGD